MALEQRQFQCHTDDGPKYWRYELDTETSQVATFTGRDPERWKPRLKAFDALDAARRFVDKAIREKMRQGFVFVRPWEEAGHGEVVFAALAPDNSVSDALDLHPDGHTLALGTTKKEAKGAALYLIDSRTGQRTEVTSFEAAGLQQTFLHAVLFDAAGDALYYALNGETRRHDLATGATDTLASFRDGHDARFNPHSVRPAQDKRRNRLLLFDRDDTVKVLEGGSTTLFSNRVGTDAASCRFGAISADGAWLLLYIASRHVSMGADTAAEGRVSEVEVWEVDSGTRLFSVPMGYNLAKVDVSSDRSTMVMAHEFAQGPGLFELPSGREVYHCPEVGRTDRWATCHDWAWSPDESSLVVGARGPWCLELTTREVTHPQRESNQRSRRIFFSDDGRLLCEGGDGGEIVLRKWAPPGRGAVDDAVAGG